MAGLKDVLEREIRDKIWREVLWKASLIDSQKIASEILEVLGLFRKVQEHPSDEELLSRFLWSLENEVSLEFKAATASRRILRILYGVKSKHRLMGFYLASWSRVYGRHALVQGVKESIGKIDVDVDELKKFSKDLLLLTYICPSDKKFARKEVARLCTLTESGEDCQKLIECLESVSKHTTSPDATISKRSTEFMLGSFFTIGNTAMYIIHERLVDPLLTEIEGFLPEGLNTPSKILGFLSDSSTDERVKTRVWKFANSYLEVIP